MSMSQRGQQRALLARAAPFESKIIPRVWALSPVAKVYGDSDTYSNIWRNRRLPVMSSLDVLRRYSRMKKESGERTMCVCRAVVGWRPTQ